MSEAVNDSKFVSKDVLLEGFKHAAERLAKRARENGFVVTIEQVSVPPLASGNHIDLVAVRSARKADATY